MPGILAPPSGKCFPAPRPALLRRPGRGSTLAVSPLDPLAGAAYGLPALGRSARPGPGKLCGGVEARAAILIVLGTLRLFCRADPIRRHNLPQAR